MIPLFSQRGRTAEMVSGPQVRIAAGVVAVLALVLAARFRGRTSASARSRLSGPEMPPSPAPEISAVPLPAVQSERPITLRPERRAWFPRRVAFRTAAAVALIGAAVLGIWSPLQPALALAPSLVWPPDGWTVDTLSPALRWNSSGYTHLIVHKTGSDIPAVDAVLGPGIDAFVPLSPLSSGTSYQWRIRSNPLSPSSSPYTWSPWTSEWSFKTAGAPPSWSSAAFVALSAPANGAVTDRLNPTLSFRIPAGTQQVEFMLIPSYNPSAAVSVVGPATNDIALPAPPTWYGLLGGTTYYWRVRATNQAGLVARDNPSWSPWSETWSFRTPVPTGGTAYSTSPVPGQKATSLTPALMWGDTQATNFYYEVQVSRDPNFVTDPFRATAMVYWEIRHGGMTNPPNSYTIPKDFSLTPGVAYFWRVRPRTGDNPAVVSWSPTWSFVTPGVSGSASIQGAAKTQQAPAKR